MVSLRDLPEKYTKRFEDQGIYETDNPFARAFQIGKGSLGQGLSQMTGLPVDLINMGLKKWEQVKKNCWVVVLKIFIDG